MLGVNSQLHQNRLSKPRFLYVCCLAVFGYRTEAYIRFVNGSQLYYLFQFGVWQSFWEASNRLALIGNKQSHLISRPGHKILSKFQVQGQVAIFIFKTRTKYFAA